jgi:hypothetical protein
LRFDPCLLPALITNSNSGSVFEREKTIVSRGAVSVRSRKIGIYCTNYYLFFLVPEDFALLSCLVNVALGDNLR